MSKQKSTKTDDKVVDHMTDSATKTAPSDSSAILVITNGNWGKGRSLEQAVHNCPSYKATEDLMIFVIHCPAGCHIQKDSADGYEDVYVDQVGRIHYPSGATSIRLSNEVHQLRTISEWEGKS